ncbi:MAG: PAS domain S-box protein [Anaerolineae bacterium]|nr:PAS domain S-box protein [Anaerolineae bacterium]
MENLDLTLMQPNSTQAYFIRQMTLISECAAVPTTTMDEPHYCSAIVQLIHQSELYGEAAVQLGVGNRDGAVMPSTSALHASISHEQHDFGVLIVTAKADQGLEKSEASCLASLAAIIGSGLASIQLRRTLQDTELLLNGAAIDIHEKQQEAAEYEREHRTMNNTLASLTLSLASQLQLSDVLGEILIQAKILVPYQTANIALLEGDSLYIRQWAGYDEASLAFVRNLRQPLDTYLLDGHVIKTKQAKVVRDTVEEPLWIVLPEMAWIKSYVNIPICSHDRVLGVLRIDGEREDQFSEETIERLAPLANAAAVAIERAALFEQVKRELAERKFAEANLQRLNQELEQKVEQRTQELRHAKDTVEAILNSSSDAIILVYADTGIERVNDTFDALFDAQSAPPNAFLKRPLDQLATYPDDAERLKEMVDAVIHDQVTRRLELAVTSWNGKIFDAEIGIAPFNGSQYGVICTLRDISEHKRMVTAVRESEAELRALFASMEDVIVVLDDDGKCLKFAPTNPVNLSTVVDTQIGRRLHELYPAKDADLFLNSIRQSLNTQQIVEIEYPLVTHGEERWYRTQYSPLSKHTVFCISRDITSRRRIEEALMESEIKFRSLVQAAPDCICLLDMDGFILEVNQAAQDTSGYTEVELLNQPVVKFIAPTYRQKFEAALRRLFEQSLLRLELEILRKDGSFLMMDCSAAVITDEFNQPSSIILLQRDITERKKVEKSLEYHASLLEKISDAVIATDLNYHIVTWNHAAQQIYGWLPEEAIGKYADMLRFQDENSVPLETIVGDLYSKGVWAGEVTQQRKDGSLVYIQSSVTLIRDGHGVANGFIAVNRDITDRKRTEIALSDSKARLAEAQRIAHLGNWEFDLILNRTRFSEEAVNILSLDAAQTDPNQTLENIFIDDRDVIQNLYRRLLINHEKSVEFEVRTNPAFGPIKFLWVTAEVVFNREGKAERLFGTILDISERKQIEDALKRSEAELRTIFNSIPHQILMIDKELTIHTINDVAQRQLMQIYQNPPHEGDNLLDFANEPSMPSMLEGINRALRGETVTQDILSPIADATNYFEVTFTPVVTAENATIGVCLLIQNITERRSSERALRESEARLNEAQRIARLGNWELDILTQTPIWSSETWRILGYEQPGEVPPSIEEQFVRIHPDDVVRLRSFMEDVLTNTTPQETEYRYLKANNQWGDYWLNCRPVIKNGKVVRLLGTLLDVTERRHNEMALRESQERLKIIFENSPDALCLGSHTKGIVDVNQTFETLTGYPRSEIVGKRPRQMKFVSHDQISKFYRLAPDALPSTIDFLLTRRDGTVLYAEARAYQIVIQSEKLILVAIRDVTARRQAEIELRQAFDKQSELYELKSRFISMTSHEFRTPLATILAASDVLRRYKDKITLDQYYQRIEKIQAQVRHMTLMLDDVSILGRIQAGNLEFRPATADVVGLFKDIIDEMEIVSEETHRIVFDCEMSTLNAYIDQKLVRQTLTNLLNNAIKYSPQGGPIEVRLEVKHDNIIFSVTDNGIGIPEQNQAHLFDPFYRADNVGNVSGSGLGLTIAKEAVTLHQGSINFVSNGDQGTTFVVQLPLVKQASLSTEN